MIEHLCFGYYNVKTQEFIAQKIIEILKKENRPMKCMEFAEKIVDENGFRYFSCQKVSAVLKKMIMVNAIQRIETILDETVEIGNPSNRKTINRKDVRFALVD